MTTGRHDRLLTANDAFLRLIGRSRDELEAGGIDWRAITPPEWRPLDDNALAQLLGEGSADLSRRSISGRTTAGSLS